MRASVGEAIAGRYVVEKDLASGGTGEVYRVLDRSTGELRALKRLTAEAAKQKHIVEAFEREYQVLAGLAHPRIIQVFDYGVDAGGPYYTMELLSGQDMRKAAPLPYREACRHLCDVATSLALLHARRLLHRDLSPGNVRMTADGRCKLIDFGALTAFGTPAFIVGTPPGVPPEALDSAPLDQRADLYALGALAYWMLTGRHAYPVRRLDELPVAWKTPPARPKAIVSDVPDVIDELVMSLLSADPSSRPASAGEVISRMRLGAELPPQDEGEAEQIAESFLLGPRFVGRADAIASANRALGQLMEGAGGALRVLAAAGMGRSRLLEEIGMRAQVAGAAVVRVDASTSREFSGTERALVLRLLDAVPRLSRERAEPHRGALAALGREVESRLVATGSVPPERELDRPRPSRPSFVGMPPRPTRAGTVDGWIVEISRAKPLVIQVDNVDDADDASLGLLVALAGASAHAPLLVVVTERVRRDPRTSVGLSTLRAQCSTVELDELSVAETLELCRSLFGEAPNVGLFADWLYERTGGSPLYCIETARRLLSDGVIRYIDGIWALPAERPSTQLPADLEDALAVRLFSLGDDARGLAECLALLREQPTLALCRLLLEGRGDAAVNRALDELARGDVLYADREGYRFASAALRDALLAGLDETRLEETHKRLGEALARLAGPDDPDLRIEAGWHLIEGGDDLRGARMIAAVTQNSATVRHMIANLHLVGRPIEAALKVFKRYRRSQYERVPLLSALAHAGYYEDRIWGERYGDEALDACEDLSGVRTARTLRPFLGRWLAMVIGITLAFLRFRLAPRRERMSSFFEMLVQLFGAVTTLTGAASVARAVARASRVTHVLELFAALPTRFAPVGIYEFCMGLREIGRERQTKAYASFEKLLRRFEDRSWYPDLPDDTRVLYVTGAHFARGAFATMQADGRAALASADALEASGLKMYAMIASQLRFLYHTNRGELAEAAAHREQVELHAAHVGSAWQVETWEGPALIPIASKLRDVDTLARITDRLRLLSRTIPSLRFYRRLSEQAFARARGAYEQVEQTTLRLIASRQPRDYIGWAASIGIACRAANESGDHAQAKALCEDALRHIDDDDREYVTLFLDLDIEMANAQAGLGETEAALARLEMLIERFRATEHPLALGSLHEARARIAWKAGRVADYAYSLTQVEHWFRRTGTPALVAKCERLAALRDERVQLPGSGPSLGDGGDAVTQVREHVGVTASAASVDREAATIMAPARKTRPPLS